MSTEQWHNTCFPAAVENRRIGVLISLFLLTSWGSFGQAPKAPQDPFHRESPQSAVLSFMEACRANDYGRAWRYLDLRTLPADRRQKEGPELARELYQGLERSGNFEVAELSLMPEGNRENGLPSNRERVTHFNLDGKTVDLELERTTFRSGTSVWLFAPETVQLIPQLVKVTSDSPIEKHVPAPLVNLKFVDTPIWRWIALAVLAIALISLSRLLSRIVLWLIEPLLKRLAGTSILAEVKRFLGPLRLLVTVGMFRTGMVWIEPSAKALPYVERALGFLLILGVAWLSAIIVDMTMSRIHMRLVERHRAFSYSVLPITGRILKLGILLLTLAVVLNEWGYNATTILTGLGLGGVAIALAAQKTIENFFGSVSVISDRPVAVGDFCKFGDRSGTVEDIGLRSTRIRTADRTLVTVPNAQFSTMTLENFSRRDKMLFHFMLNLRRDTTPDQVRTVLDSVGQLLQKHDKVEPGALPVRFIGVGTYSLDLEVFVYILTRDGDEFMTLQQNLLLHILDAVEAAGTALALPTQASVTYSSSNAPMSESPADRRR